MNSKCLLLNQLGTKKTFLRSLCANTVRLISLLGNISLNLYIVKRNQFLAQSVGTISLHRRHYPSHFKMFLTGMVAHACNPSTLRRQAKGWCKGLEMAQELKNTYSKKYKTKTIAFLPEDSDSVSRHSHQVVYNLL